MGGRKGNEWHERTEQKRGKKILYSMLLTRGSSSKKYSSIFSFHSFFLYFILSFSISFFHARVFVYKHVDLINIFIFSCPQNTLCCDVIFPSPPLYAALFSLLFSYSFLPISRFLSFLFSLLSEEDLFFIFQGNRNLDMDRPIFL